MATKTAFHQYVKDVKLTVGGTDYTFSCWNLSVRVHSYTGTDKIAEQLVDGSWRQRIDGFHIEITFDANMQIIDITDYATIRDGMEALYAAGTGTIDLDPVDDAGNKVLTVVVAKGEGISKATHQKGVRNNPASFSLITSAVQTTIPQWLMDEVSVYPYEGTDTEILLISDKGITQAAGLITAMADQSAAGNDMTTATALTASGDAFGAGVSPLTGALTSFIRTAGNQPLSGMAGTSAVGRIWMVVRHTTGASAGDTILDITDAAGTHWTALNILAATGLLQFIDSDGVATLNGTTSLDDSDAHLVEVEIDLANDTVTMYLDGTQEATTALWTGDLSGTSSATHYIQLGGDAAKRDAAFATFMPFLMIDSATPDATRIQAIRNFCAKRFGIINLLSD